jgi:hypothetical protein
MVMLLQTFEKRSGELMGPSFSVISSRIATVMSTARTIIAHATEPWHMRQFASVDDFKLRRDGVKPVKHALRHEPATSV